MMKKLMLFAVVALAFTAVAQAQPKAVGLRLTGGFEATYQHILGARDNFIEADLGYIVGTRSTGDWCNMVALYDFMIAKPDWTTKGEWGFYAGPGIAIGAGKKFAIGVAGNVGLEYTFWFPLQLSFDIRPQIGYVADKFNIWGWYPAISARYRF